MEGQRMLRGASWRQVKEMVGKYLDDDEDMKDLNLTAKQADGLARSMTLQVPPSPPPPARREGR